jgi:hypothetical protein
VLCFFSQEDNPKRLISKLMPFFCDSFDCVGILISRMCHNSGALPIDLIAFHGIDKPRTEWRSVCINLNDHVKEILLKQTHALEFCFMQTYPIAYVNILEIMSCYVLFKGEKI